MRHHRILVTAVAAAWLWTTPSVGAVSQGETARLTVRQSDTYGPYLTDATGRALYLFTADQPGHGGTPAASQCYQGCAEAWPPLLALQPQAGDQVEASYLGTMQRNDGGIQVTYQGWPLYYYTRDTGPGTTTGQGVSSFGGGWYLVNPQGQKIEKKP